MVLSLQLGNGKEIKKIGGASKAVVNKICEFFENLWEKDKGKGNCSVDVVQGCL